MTQPIHPKVSAGLLLFRREGATLSVFLAHPGGPFWATRDAGAWTIPKGVPEADEDLLVAAQREFGEETGLSATGPFLSLGSVRQLAGKVVHGWAFEGDANPSAVQSNIVRCQWPPRSGNWISVPEIDRCAWFEPPQARRQINVAQVAFIDRLEAMLAAGEQPLSARS